MPERYNYAAWRRGELPEPLKYDSLFGFWSYVDVRDVCSATLLGLTAQVGPFDAFLLAAGDTLSSDPTQVLVEKYYPRIPWVGPPFPDYFSANPFRSLLDCSRAEKMLGWKPRFTWRDPALDVVGFPDTKAAGAL
jgi:nucleoside-diphosphate-sugar epimerase